jgi:hypothetical protein
MIPEYKLYHGAVLADIVDSFAGEVTFRSQGEGKRLLNYVINDCVGLQIKYATQRLRPWHFSFSLSHISSLKDMAATLPACFVVLVCRTDGLIAVRAEDILASLCSVCAEQAWLRADRKKREMYRLYGPEGEFPAKFKTTVTPIVEVLTELGALRERTSVPQ